jgi:heme A synthase
MDFDFISVTTFWRILLFLHFVMAVALLAAVTLQLVTVLAPAPVTQSAGNFVERIRATPPRWYVAAIIILYVPTFLLGAWVYQVSHLRANSDGADRPLVNVGTFEFKEHIVSMGMAMLPAYWYVWREPFSEALRPAQVADRFLAVAVWYSFLVGHVASD